MKSILAVLLLAFSLQVTAAPRTYIVEFKAGIRSDALTELRGERRFHVRREFSRVLNGAAIELAEGVSVEEIARMPFVARVTPDVGVSAYGGRRGAGGTAGGAPAPRAAAGGAPAPRAEAGGAPAPRAAAGGAPAPRAAAGGAPAPRAAAGGAPASRAEAGGAPAPRAAVGETPAPRVDAGEGIVVAVVDTGIDGHHPALAGKVIGGYDFVNEDADPMDDHRHGTHVAGIIAASSATMNGVAPGVSLLAYKVLDHTGNGVMSDIVAGIDRAVLDGADVINLSLGSGGHPDDPMARAVDAATAAGVVVVVAAGNEGEFHTIGSPGVAATAITVGAWENATTIADFSSRGPANRSGAIKPEVLAPGVSILSTVLNGELGHSSGTSMATPYVAGIAALLRAEHPEWPPARVKAAIVSTALPIATDEVMAQGTGRVDLDRAFASEIVASPAQVNFGLDGGMAPLWTSTRTLSLRNEGNVARAIHLRNESTLGIRVTPEDLTLAPGETREVEVAIDVDHAIIGKPQTRSLSFGGWIVLEWDGGDARVPWAFVRAARAVVTYPAARPLVLWNIDGRYASFAVEANGVEALLEPDVYDLVAVTEHHGDVRIFVSEEQSIAGDVMFALTDADAPHAVALDGVDARGLPLVAPLVRARFVLPEESIVLPPFGRTLHTSSFSPKYALLAMESSLDGKTMHVVQHAPVRGIDADVTLRNQPAEFLADEVQLRFADAVSRSIQVMPRDWPRRPGDFGSVPQSFTTTSTENSWRLRLFMTPEHAGDHVGGVQIAAFRTDDVGAGVPEVITPMIRRDGDGFFAAWGFPRPEVADTTLAYGGGAIHGISRFTASPSSFGGTYEVRGEGGEFFRRVPSSFSITNANGVEVAKGDGAYMGLFTALPGAGRYRAEVRTGDSVMKLEFTSANGAIATLPSLTSLSVSADSLVFSVADFDGDAYRRVPEDLTNVFFRRRGRTTWVQLSPVRIAEEDGTYESLVRFPYGNIYRVDLADAVRISRDLEIAIEVVDVDGNSSSWVTPVVIPTTKRRAVRR